MTTVARAEASTVPVVVQQRVRRVLVGLVSAGLLTGLWGLAVAGRWPLGAGVLVVQLLLVLAVLAVVDAPASGGTFVIGAAASVAADAVVLTRHGQVGDLTGVVALSLVAGLLQQLVRRPRPRVTESLADLLLVVVLVSGAACVLAALQLPHARTPTLAALAGAAAGLGAGRVGDLVVWVPRLSAGTTRAWPGFVLGLGVGVGVTAAIARHDLVAGRTALLGLSVSAAVAAADLVTDLTRVEIDESEDPRDGAQLRRLAALVPTGVLLPVAVAGPVLLLAVRLVTR